jgi:hypothetical protein
VDPAASTTEFENDIDGGPLWGALPVGPIVSTTEVEDDVNGRPPWGCCQWVRQRPPLSFEDDVNGGPLGGAAGGCGSVRHRVLKMMGLDPILCSNILQNRAWKAVIILMGLVPQAVDLRYA